MIHPKLTNTLFEEAALQGRQQITRQDPSFKSFSGQDLDDYVAIHMDRYEAATKHRSECSSEEWERGADGAYTSCCLIIYVG